MSEHPPSAGVVLVVDDSEINRYVVNRTLVRAGYTVLQAANGKTALEMAARAPDLVLLDVRLPDMSGYDVCAKLKTDPRFQRVPVIHTSAAFTRAEDHLRGVEGGADGFLATPIDPLILLSTIKAWSRVRKAERDQEQLHARLKLTIDAASMGTWDQNMETGEMNWSPRCRELFGFSADARVDRETWTAIVHPEDMPLIQAAYDRALSDSAEFRVQYRVFWPDHSLHWLSVIGRSSYDPEAKAKRLTGVVMDISKDKQREAELRGAIRARDEFLSIASHELKTPLTSLRLQAQMTRRKFLGPGEATIPAANIRRMVEQSEVQVNRLCRLVDDMLDISQIAAGKLSLRRERFDLSDAVRDVTERLAPILTEAQCEVRMDLKNGAVGWWDRDRLEQIVINLLTNAAKFGAGKPIEVVLDSGEEGATLTIRDHGRGIAQSDQSRIFRRFERAVPDSQIGGLGLGLFIANQIAAMHGADIRVKSEPGDGASFIVTLPYTGEPKEIPA